MATNNSDHQYDCGFRLKGQGQIYLNSVSWLSTRAPTAFILLKVFVFGTTIAYGVLITMKVSDHWYDVGVNSQGQIYFISVLRLVTRTPLSIAEGGCSNLGH